LDLCSVISEKLVAGAKDWLQKNHSIREIGSQAWAKQGARNINISGSELQHITNESKAQLDHKHERNISQQPRSTTHPRREAPLYGEKLKLHLCALKGKPEACLQASRPWTYDKWNA